MEPGGEAYWPTAFFQSNAVFTGLLLTLLIVYFGSERSVLHVSRNLRRVYFLLLVTLLSYWLLSAVQNAGSGGIEILLIFVVIMASIVEDKMERAIYLTPFSSRSLDDVVGTPEAIGKAELLDAIARGMSRWQGFSIGLAKQLAWLDGSLHKRQAAIHQVLTSANKDELNFILAHNNAATLLEVAAERTVDALTSWDGSLRNLTTLSRAILLDGFQKIGLRHRPLRQAYAHRILMHTHAEDLSELKAYLDDGPDYHTTFKLLYSDFQGEVQQEVLEHVSVEGHRALAHFRKGHPKLPGMTLKVVSDIDDTLMCSGGHFPAGSDLRYPKNCVYPGVLAFYRGLDTAFASRVQEQEQAGSSANSTDMQVRAFLKRGNPNVASVKGASPRALRRMSPTGIFGRERTPSPQRRPQNQIEGEGTSQTHFNRLTSWNLRRKNAVEEAEGSRQPDNLEDRTSGNLESIAESSRWEGESDADSAPEYRKRFPEGRAESWPGQPGAEIPDLRGRSSEESTTAAKADPVNDDLTQSQRGGRQSCRGEPERGEADSEAESSASVRLGNQTSTGTSNAGAALSAVLPSANSMQQMVGLTLLAGMPSVASPVPRRNRGKCRSAAGERGRAESLPPTEEVFQPRQSSGHLVFLSARPESYKGFTEGLSFKRIFEPLVRRGELQGYPVLLLGSMRVGPTALYAYAADRRGAVGPASMQFYRALAEKKLSRFKQFAAIYPECCWVFVGDNGQGDVILAEHLAELLGTKLVACFIHQVVPLSETATVKRKGQVRVQEEVAAGWPQQWRAQNIFLGSDYISLAVEAHRHNLLDLLALQAVALDAVYDLRHVSARFAHSTFDRNLAVQQVNSGIAAANAVLPEGLRVQPLQDSPKKRWL